MRRVVSVLGKGLVRACMGCEVVMYMCMSACAVSQMPEIVRVHGGAVAVEEEMSLPFRFAENGL